MCAERINTMQQPSKAHKLFYNFVNQLLTLFRIDIFMGQMMYCMAGNEIIYHKYIGV